MDPFAPLSKLSYDAGEFQYLVPIAIPAIFGLVVLVLDLYLRRGRNKANLAIVTFVACLLAGGAAVALWTGNQDKVVLGGALATSGFSASLALAALVGTTLIGFAVAHHGQTEDGTLPPGSLAHGELYGLMLFATSGMLALIVANDLVTFFVAVETLSLAVYALAGLDRRRPRSAEGAMKYFILGAFSSGFLLYGISLIYGGTHTLRLDEIAQALPADVSAPLASTGAILLMIGLLFKVAAVPFHAYAPDAYEGAPAAVTGFMSIGVKVAAFAGTLRVLTALGECGAIGTAGVWALWGVCALTVIVGNAGALTQRNPRRLLAYSAIAHSGYVLVGVVALMRSYDANHPTPSAELLLAGKDAAAGILFYLLAYAVGNAAAFGVLCYLERDGEDIDRVSDLAGLGRTQPGIALVMSIAMISLAGLPGTAGFIGKLWVFRAGVAAGDIGLVVLALLASALSLYYYLYFVVVMYMHEPSDASPAGVQAGDRGRWTSRLALGAAGVLTIALGVLPLSRLMRLMIDGGEALL